MNTYKTEEFLKIKKETDEALYGKQHHIEDVFYESPLEISMEELKVPKHKCFLISNIFTEKECEHYVKLSEELGYQALKEFTQDTRNSKRVFLHSKKLAEVIWKRIEPLCDKFTDLKPYGIDNTQGTWKAYGVDECFRFSKYSTDNYFKRHVDSVYTVSKDEKSILSILIYLNSDYQGGETNIYETFDAKDPLHKVKGKIGSGMIFTHDMVHEGCEVTKNTKYIIRVDLMFKRIDPVFSNQIYPPDEKMIKEVSELFLKAFELEKKGNIQESVEYYLKGLAIQLKSPSVVEFTPCMFHQDIFAEICSFLEPNDIAKCMQVSKGWLKASRNQDFWHKLYIDKWEKVKPDPYQDWQFLYQKRYIQNKDFRFFIVNFDKEHAHYGFFDGEYSKIDMKLKSVVEYRGSHFADECVFQFGEGDESFFHDGYVRRFHFGCFFNYLKYIATHKEKLDLWEVRNHTDNFLHPIIIVQNGDEMDNEIIESLYSSNISYFNRAVALVKKIEKSEATVISKEETRELRKEKVKVSEVVSFEKTTIDDLKKEILSNQGEIFIFYNYSLEDQKEVQDSLKNAKNITFLGKKDVFEGISSICKYNSDLFGFKGEWSFLDNFNGETKDKLIMKYSNLIYKNIKKVSKDELKNFLNLHNDQGLTPLHLACYHGDLNLMIFFINNHADFNIKDKANGQNILHIAASRCLDLKKGAEILEYCIEQLDLNINEQDNDGNTPLHILSSKGDDSSILYLKRKKAKYLENKKGFKPQDLYVKREDSWMDPWNHKSWYGEEVE